MSEVLRELREQAGLSQSQLAARSGVAQPNIAVRVGTADPVGGDGRQTPVGHVSFASRSTRTAS
ncbi:helix-turn-helix transcriptional regulator [Microbacterium sp.]|uniref:helix-turn-helix transcriptional regulator n=1 Tax=Microbacterium sp. TaxID=51671 RepID=UPI003A9493FD